MLSNLFYHKKTGVIFTIFFLIVMPIYSFEREGSFYFVFSLILYIVLYVIPINFIVIFQKKKLKQEAQEVKLKFYDNNLGSKLLHEFNECKTDADYELWEKRNSKYFETVRAFVIQEIEKKHNNSLDQINKLDRKIEIFLASVSIKKSSIEDLFKRHPFLKKLIKHKNYL